MLKALRLEVQRYGGKTQISVHFEEPVLTQQHSTPERYISYQRRENQDEVLMEASTRRAVLEGEVNLLWS